MHSPICKIIPYLFIQFLIGSICFVGRVNAQYAGGSGRGTAADRAYQIELNGNALKGIYHGGLGAGLEVCQVFGTTLSGNNLNVPYSGANGKGENAASKYALLLTGTNIDNLYVGGNGRGEQVDITFGLSLGGTNSDIVYYGGNGRGESMAFAFEKSFLNCTTQNIWSGNISNAWELPGNWTCNKVPGTNDRVVIPNGLVRYPVVNINTEIKSLQIGQNATIEVKGGITLKLNGQ